MYTFDENGISPNAAGDLALVAQDFEFRTPLVGDLLHEPGSYPFGVLGGGEILVLGDLQQHTENKTTKNMHYPSNMVLKYFFQQNVVFKTKILF